MESTYYELQYEKHADLPSLEPVGNFDGRQKGQQKIYPHCDSSLRIVQRMDMKVRSVKTHVKWALKTVLVPTYLTSMDCCIIACYLVNCSIRSAGGFQLVVLATGLFGTSGYFGCLE
jgi:hypothetical protein